jgi:hypothetical protein
MAMTDPSYIPLVYRRQGGNEMVVKNGGQITLEAGGAIVGAVVTKAATSYTYALADAGTWVRHNNASAITATVPPNSSVAFPVSTQITVEQTGAGLLTLAAGAGVTINKFTTLKLAGQWAVAILIKVRSDEWTVAGNMAAT